MRRLIITTIALLLNTHCTQQSRADSLEEHTSTLLEKTARLIKLDQPERAIEILKTYKPRPPERAYFFFLKGRALQDQKKNTEALESYTISLFLNSSNIKALINRALVKGALKDLDGAMNDLNKALEINPKSKEAMMNRGVTNAGLGKPNNAIYDFTEAIRVDPLYADAHRNRGITWNHLGKKEKACEDWRTATKLGQQDVSQWVQRLCSSNSTPTQK